MSAPGSDNQLLANLFRDRGIDQATYRGLESGAADGLLMGAPATPASRAVWDSRQTWLNGRVSAWFRLKGRILWIC